MSARLIARNLTLVRGNRRVLDDVTLAIAAGGITAILGPNGSGKSTLLRVLAGIRPPDSGVVALDGRVLSGMRRREVARRVSLLPQDVHCDFAFTVEEMVALGRHPHRNRFAASGERDRRVIEAAIAFCDLERLRTRSIHRLSGGERQRVAIARCLAAEPDVLLLDEPAAHLDIEHALSVLALCRTLAAAGRAVVLATHDLGMVPALATEAVLLRAGRIVASGAPCDVLTPQACRDVFKVDAALLTSSDGRSAFAFSSPAGTPSPPHATGVIG